MKPNYVSILFTLALAMISSGIFAQEAVKARKSPLEVVTYKSPDTYVKIMYGRPHKQGRDIFGQLVPYGKIWRTGANEATEITTTGTITLAGKSIPAGTYSVFTIPQKDKWTIILNKDLGLWGSYQYKQEQDFIRFDVPVQQLEETYEPFTIEFETVGNDVNLKMMWETTGVSMPVTF